MVTGYRQAGKTASSGISAEKIISVLKEFNLS
jgi:hypothetical protein